MAKVLVELTALQTEIAYAHVRIGNVLRSQGRENEAIAEYKKATQIDRNNDIAYANLGHALTVSW